MNDCIDFVIPWVDGNDSEWQKRKKKIESGIDEDDSTEKYRDWNLLKYWFRGIESFAPWVNTIWFICDQKPPKWLNTKHPKLRIIKHEDYLLKEYLPCFSSRPIELNFHRIKGLSEKFVYFNDDMFLISKVSPTYFFKKGLPRDSALLNAIPADTIAKGLSTSIVSTALNNTEYINRDYSFYKSIHSNIFKWYNPIYGKKMIKNMICSLWPIFIGFEETHLPQSYLKSSYVEAWEQYYDILSITSRNHLRHNGDVTHWLIREKQLAEGKFYPRKQLKNAVFILQNDNNKMYDAIEKQKIPFICLNDVGKIDINRFNELSKKIQKSFNKILPNKSSFEL